MNAGQKAVSVEVSEDELKVELLDGRTIIVPLAWYPRLLHATPAQAANWTIAGGGFRYSLARRRRGLERGGSSPWRSGATDAFSGLIGHEDEGTGEGPSLVGPPGVEVQAALVEKNVRADDLGAGIRSELTEKLGAVGPESWVAFSILRRIGGSRHLACFMVRRLSTADLVPKSLVHVRTEFHHEGFHLRHLLVDHAIRGRPFSDYCVFSHHVSE